MISVVVAVFLPAAACGGATVQRSSAGAIAPQSSIGTDVPKNQGASRTTDLERSKAPGVCPTITEASKPWLTDKDLSDKLLKSGTSGQGAVLVKYDDCRIDVLADCKVRGSYSFKPTKRTKVEEILYHMDEMYAQLPFDAPKLRAEFQKGGIWSFQAAIVGDYETSTESIGRDQIDDECADATHFLKAFSIGAFRLEVIKDKAQKADKTLLLKGGAFERCLLSETDASSEACRNVVRMNLRPIALKSALSPSDQHFLLNQPTGSERAGRIEPDHMGEMVELPTPQKTTAVVFWSAACEPCAEEEEDDKDEETICEPCGEDLVWESSKKIMIALEKTWGEVNRKKAQIIGVAVDMDNFRARNRLGDLPVTFPVVADSETGKLKNRFQVENHLPQVFVIDEKGYVRFYADCSEGDAEKIDKAVRALSGE
jgi:hypothetical protein